MKIMMLRNTFVSGKTHHAGKEYDLLEADARLLIQMKKAAAVPIPAPVRKEEKKRKGK